MTSDRKPGHQALIHAPKIIGRHRSPPTCMWSKLKSMRKKHWRPWPKGWELKTCETDSPALTQRAISVHGAGVCGIILRFLWPSQDGHHIRRGACLPAGESSRSQSLFPMNHLSLCLERKAFPEKPDFSLDWCSSSCQEGCVSRSPPRRNGIAVRTWNHQVSFLSPGLQAKPAGCQEEREDGAPGWAVLGVGHGFLLSFPCNLGSEEEEEMGSTQVRWLWAEAEKKILWKLTAHDDEWLRPGRNDRFSPARQTQFSQLFRSFSLYHQCFRGGLAPETPGCKSPGRALVGPTALEGKLGFNNPTCFCLQSPTLQPQRQTRFAENMRFWSFGEFDKSWVSSPNQGSWCLSSIPSCDGT